MARNYFKQNNLYVTIIALKDITNIPLTGNCFNKPFGAGVLVKVHSYIFQVLFLLFISTSLYYMNLFKQQLTYRKGLHNNACVI